MEQPRPALFVLAELQSQSVAGASAFVLRMAGGILGVSPPPPACFLCLAVERLLGGAGVTSAFMLVQWTPISELHAGSFKFCFLFKLNPRSCIVVWNPGSSKAGWLPPLPQPAKRKPKCEPVAILRIAGIVCL